MESSGGPPEQQSGGGPPPPPPAGSGSPPPAPPPGANPGAGPQSPPAGPGPQSPGSPPGEQWGAPPGAAPPGYAQPGQAPGYQPPPGYGYGTPGAPVAYGYAPPLPPVLQGREFAGYGARVGAYLLDALIGVALLITIVGWIFIPSMVMARKGQNNGQTWGKQAVGIRVIKEDGQPYEFGDAFVREFLVKWLLFGFIGGFFFIPWLVDLLWPLWDERKQALHDKMVSSYVVKA